jgi:hypothetical protein
MYQETTPLSIFFFSLPASATIAVTVIVFTASDGNGLPHIPPFTAQVDSWPLYLSAAVQRVLGLLWVIRPAPD